MRKFDFVVNNNMGLGDCLSCFNTDKQLWSPSPHFATLRRFSLLKGIDSPSGVGLDVCSLDHVEFKNQHLFNRVRIVSGLDPLDKPKAMLDLVQYNPKKENIAFSFDTGNVDQSALHPRARQLYPEHRQTIQEFFSRNRDKYNFVEVGTRSFAFQDTLDLTGIGLDKTIGVLEQCQHYIGMHSGMMHLATAIGLACTIIINFPTLERISQDTTQDATDAMDWEKCWLYPQHNYLHEDVANNITVDNLQSILT